MIQGLISDIVAVLRTAYAGAFSGPGDSPEDHIVIGPDSPNPSDLPYIAVYQGMMEVGTQFRDTISSEVRPQDIKESFTISGPSPPSTFSLSQTPLEGTAFCQLIYSVGTVNERKRTLVLNTDYSVNTAAPEINLNIDISDADRVVVTYSYAGVFTLRDFRQEFTIDVYHNSSSEIEEWAAITTTIILTHHNELLEDFNSTQYSMSQFVSQHSASQLIWLSGIPDHSSSPLKYTLTFQVAGQIKAIKTTIGDFGVIERIHSPGADSGHSIDIDPQLS